MKRIHWVTGAGAALLIVLGAIFWLAEFNVPPTAQAPQPHAVLKLAALSEDPFERVIAVLADGASAQEIEAAVDFLDTTTRLGVPLTAQRQSTLITALQQGTPPGMTTGSWAHLFNSACNALATGGSPSNAGLVALLEHYAVQGAHHEIRLYAMQHLGMCYTECDVATRHRLRKWVSGILAERPVSPVAGMALVLATQWDAGRAAADSASLLESARLVAADPTVPVDVRVSALHTAGENASVLATARVLAADTSQPVILRKSAIYLIGRHGLAADLPLLERCVSEGFRLAQAGEPARKTLQARLNGEASPIFRPY